MDLSDSQSSNLSKAISAYLNGYPYIKIGLKEGIVNYSALARKISPEIEKQLSKKINEETVMVAIKRYSDKENFLPIEPKLLEYYRDMSLTLEDSMAFVLLARDDEITASIYNSLKNVKWNSSEFRFALGSPSSETIIVEKDRLASVIAGISKEKILELEEDLSIVTARLHLDAFKNSNLITEFANELSKSGISYMVLATPPEIRFLIKDENAQRVYTSIKSFSKMAEEKLAKLKRNASE